MARVLIFSFAIALAGCSSPRCESPDAQSLVTALRPETQFKAMLKMFVERTETFAMANAKDGSGTRRKLDAALDRAFDRHGAQWERNLVAAWGTLDSAELAKVCSSLSAKNDPTFMQSATRVAPAVKSTNEPLLKQAATEVLGEIWD